MDAIDFGYATEIVRKNKKAKASRRGRRVNAEGQPLRKGGMRRKIAKVAVFSFFFGGFGS